MALSNYYITLQKSVYSSVSDGGGGQTPSYATAVNFQGFINTNVSKEIITSAQLKESIDAMVFTEETLASKDRVLDAITWAGETLTYEIVGRYNNFHKYYLLKTVAP